MNHKISIILVLTLVAVLIGSEGVTAQVTGSSSSVASLETAFTYQGTLKLNGTLVDDLCDFQFSLWDAFEDPSTQVGNTQTHKMVTVAEGLFVIPALDFGAGAFDGAMRWLQIAVRCPAGNGPFTTLAPRQALNPVPYALYAPQAGSVPWGGLEGVPSGFTDGVDNETSFIAGPGVVITGTQILVDFAGSGADPTAARSDHDHWGQTWEGPDFGLTLRSNSNFSNSAALTSSAISQGTGVLGLAVPSNASAGMLVPVGVAGISLLPAGGFLNSTYGVFGQADGAGGYGVYGYGTYTGTLGMADGSSGKGVYGESTGSGGTGVWGQGANGMYALSTVSSGNGLVAVANNGSLAFGVWGVSSQGYAGYFSGKVNVTGNLTKAGGSFRIDHPLDPINKYLNHSFVESPDMKNIYDGVVVLDQNGSATVSLPDWFEALNRDFRYQLTCIGGYAAVYIAQEIENGTFVIAGGMPGLKVSWQVTGIRQDPWANDNRIQVEELKPAQATGTYLYPQGYGQPVSLGEDYVREQQLLENQEFPAGDSQTPVTPSLAPGVWIDWLDDPEQQSGPPSASQP